MKHLRLVGLFFVLSGCGDGSASDPPDGTVATGGAGASAAGAFSGDAGSTSGDSGAIGVENGPTPFVVAEQLWAGSPDDSATTVIFVLSKPVACAEISSPGWDTRLPSGTQVIEMKAFGKGPAMYTVVTTQTPAPGEAAVNFTHSMNRQATETSASGGWVTIDTLNGTNVTGSYALNFGATRINGWMDATRCAGGVEP